MKVLRMLVLLALMLALPVSAFAQDDAPVMGAWEACADPASLSGEVNLGIAFALSEAAAIYGTPQRQAAEMAIAEINESGYRARRNWSASTKMRLAPPKAQLLPLPSWSRKKML